MRGEAEQRAFCSDTIVPGSRIGERYEVLGRLGTSGLGVVYLCQDFELQCRVSIKFLSDKHLSSQVAVSRFQRESATLREINHPNVIRCLDFFRVANTFALVLEHVNGCNLREYVEGKGALPVSEVMKIVSQLCLGVQAVHDKGIVHRDLKAENILIDGAGGIKISDLSTSRDAILPSLTQHGGLVGSFESLSPEYIANGQLDKRSDLYAIGVLTYRMLTGESPFKNGGTVVETLTRRTTLDPTPALELRQDCPERLNDFIARAMSRDPDFRFQSATEMQREIVLVDTPRRVVVSSQVVERRFPKSSFSGTESFDCESDDYETDGCGELTSDRMERIASNFLDSAYEVFTSPLTSLRGVMERFLERAPQMPEGHVQPDRAVRRKSQPLRRRMKFLKKTFLLLGVKAIIASRWFLRLLSKLSAFSVPVVALGRKITRSEGDLWRLNTRKGGLCVGGILCLLAPAVSMNDNAEASSEKKPSAEVRELTQKTSVIDAPQEEKQSPYVTHIVKKGETISLIAMRKTTSLENWREILRVNPELDPLRLEPGHEVRIPRALLK